MGRITYNKTNVTETQDTYIKQTLFLNFNSFFIIIFKTFFHFFSLKEISSSENFHTFTYHRFLSHQNSLSFSLYTVSSIKSTTQTLKSNNLFFFLDQKNRFFFLSDQTHLEDLLKLLFSQHNFRGKFIKYGFFSLFTFWVIFIYS
jgi:hypothetical protein